MDLVYLGIAAVVFGATIALARLCLSLGGNP